jgi:hypothetical protein
VTTINVSSTAAAIVDTISGAKSSRPFENGVKEFVRVLRTMSDGTPGDTSAATIQVMQSLAETVIQLIEARLAENVDPARVQRRLAQGVYDIRRTLEEADHWRRHYAGR